MPRKKREIPSSDAGAVHIISRTADAATRFTPAEKKYLLELIRTFASGFYVKIHAFSVMGNHFHILASSCEKAAAKADFNELLKRYRGIYGAKRNPPAGSSNGDGTMTLDEDGGEARLRRRLASMSRFVQEFKQRFSCWYNRQHKRRGYLWGDRFKSVLVEKGNPVVFCSAYIDLNAVRAGMCQRPEDYRFCSMGQYVRNRRNFENWVDCVHSGSECVDSEMLDQTSGTDRFFCYRHLVYALGGVYRENKASISDSLADEVFALKGKWTRIDCFRYRVRNLSEGIAVGGANFIAQIQRRNRRRYICPREFVKGLPLYSTRALRN